MEQNMKVANWGANDPDIGYGDLRVALDLRLLPTNASIGKT